MFNVRNFPTFPISKQLFHAPGAAIDGGFTSGGARIQSPEPGGFSMLEIQPSLQVNEWGYPISSWLMSQTNGQLLRVRLAPTPQIASGRVLTVPWGVETPYPDSPWSNQQNWNGDLTAVYSAASLEGSNTLVVDLSQIGPVLRHGHVIGHKDTTYLVDDIVYNNSGIATVTTNPPLRNNVEVGDVVYFRSYFIGTIVNGSDFRNTYDADQVGNIQLGKIILMESILPNE